MLELDIIQTFTLARPFEKSYWVIPGRFIAGEYPGSVLLPAACEKVGGLLNLGVDTFINLTVEDHLPPYEPTMRMLAARMGRVASHYKMGFRDFSVPSTRDMVKILDTIDEALRDEHNVYVHCWGGIGRTGTVVGCYLARHGITGQAALDQIAQMRLVVPSSRVSPETDEQRKMVTSWREGQ